MVLAILTNCIFYASVFPIGIVVSFFGLLFAYWTSKIWLTKFCSIPNFSYLLGRLIVKFILKIE